MASGEQPTADRGVETDDSGGRDQRGPYLNYVQRGVQGQFYGLLFVVFPKRMGTEILTLVGLLLFGAALIATALLVLADARYAGSTEADYRPGWIRWPILSLFAPLAGGYAYHRRRQRSID